MIAALLLALYVNTIAGVPVLGLGMTNAGAPATVSELSSCTSGAIVQGNGSGVLQCPSTLTYASSATFQNHAFSVGSDTFTVTQGQVGIGTSAPKSGAALDVVGRILLDTNNLAYRGVRSDGTTQIDLIKLGADNKVYVDPSGQGLYLGIDGVTGINNTGPSATLEVTPEASHSYSVIFSSANGSTNLYGLDAVNVQHEFTGSVGIGTTSPNTKLHISSGALMMDGNLAYAQFTAQTSTPTVGSSRVDLQACKLEYSIVSPK